MRSCEGNTPWKMRWRYLMAPTSRPGIWKLKEGGYYVRVRATDPRTTRRVDRSCLVNHEGATLMHAVRAQDELRLEATERATGPQLSKPLWGDFAVSLLKGKIAEGRLKSAKTKERWKNVLERVVPEFGLIPVDKLRALDILAWRDKVGEWISDGMPSIRKKDADKDEKVIVKLSPVTANGWLSIVKVICKAMTKRFEFGRDPAEPAEYFRTTRTYTREQPNALSVEQMPKFLAKLKELHPQHYAMAYLGFIIGARPSSLRPLRRSGPEADVLWDEGFVLLRRSNSLGQEIMDETKTANDQDLPLPPEAFRVLREHVDALPPGPMRDSVYLFPSVVGGMRSRSALDKPFADVRKALGWSLRLTPRGMRRTFKDLARQANVSDVVSKAISGHETDRMHKHYSTARVAEMRNAVGKVISIATARPQPRRRPKGDGST